MKVRLVINIKINIRKKLEEEKLIKKIKIIIIIKLLKIKLIITKQKMKF